MVFCVKSDEEALEVANNTSFGLANAVFTQDRKKAFYFANNLESGSVAINQLFKSDVRLPFNGRKNSGYGIELSTKALFEFTAIKTIIGKV
jgi:succinate-semialdehyde dehydrogenase/glutarate-semialdehyde dehydrogenase